MFWESTVVLVRTSFLHHSLLTSDALSFTQLFLLKNASHNECICKNEIGQVLSLRKKGKIPKQIFTVFSNYKYSGGTWYCADRSHEHEACLESDIICIL